MFAVTHNESNEPISSILFFFFNDTATTEIYTLSLHDALPISSIKSPNDAMTLGIAMVHQHFLLTPPHSVTENIIVGLKEIGRSTRLNSSHANISYAVFCLKQKISTKCHPYSAQDIVYCSLFIN